MPQMTLYNNDIMNTDNSMKCTETFHVLSDSESLYIAIYLGTHNFLFIVCGI